MGVKYRGIFRLFATPAFSLPAHRALRFGEEWKQFAEHFTGALLFLVPLALPVKFPRLRRFYRYLAKSEPMQKPQHSQPFQSHTPVPIFVPSLIIRRTWLVLGPVCFYPFAERLNDLFVREYSPAYLNHGMFRAAAIDDRRTDVRELQLSHPLQLFFGQSGMLPPCQPLSRSRDQRSDVTILTISFASKQEPRSNGTILT